LSFAGQTHLLPVTPETRRQIFIFEVNPRSLEAGENRVEFFYNAPQTDSTGSYGIGPLFLLLRD